MSKLAKSAHMPSEDAPFYGIFLVPANREWLPSRSRYPLTPEEETLRHARHVRLLELGTDYPRLDLFFQFQFPLELHLIEKKVRAKGAKLKKIAHWNRFWALSPTETEFHKVVSPQWKEAVESLEPGVHEFFPFTIEFDRPEGENIYAAFVMRERIWITEHEPDSFLGYRHRSTDALGTWQGRPKEPGGLQPEVTLKFARTAVAGRHWFRAGNPFNNEAVPIIVSKALLERLLPLIPHESYFIPAYVA
jgi:hypothetical protein